NPELLAAILSALEREQHSAPGRASKLQRLLMDDRQLFQDMFGNADVGLARDAMRRLQLSPLFDELTKRSLLARIVKVFPDLESMIAGAQAQEKAGLVVSWSSLEKRKAEYEELVKKKIQETYTILGAWDGNPDRNVISYQTAIGQALLGHKAGEVVTLPNGEFEILSIESAPVDKVAGDPAVAETEPASV